MHFRVNGAWQDTGEDAVVEVEAGTARDAAKAANSRGMFVSAVTLLPAEPAPDASAAGRRGRRARKRAAGRRVGSGDRLLLDLAVFRRLIAPYVVVVAFWFAVLSVIVGGLFIAIDLVREGRNATSQQITTALVWLPSSLAGLFVFRLFCEVLIVLFRISESAADIRDDLRGVRQRLAMTASGSAAVDTASESVCGSCGYALAGLRDGVPCPECGAARPA